MDTKHTPTPWEVLPSSDPNQLIVMGGGTSDPALPYGGRFVCLVPARKQANAEFIARACNCHDEMREALSGLVEHVSESDLATVDAATADKFRRAMSALSKAAL